MSRLKPSRVCAAPNNHFPNVAFSDDCFAHVKPHGQGSAANPLHFEQTIDEYQSVGCRQSLEGSQRSQSERPCTTLTSTSEVSTG